MGDVDDVDFVVGVDDVDDGDVLMLMIVLVPSC